MERQQYHVRHGQLPEVGGNGHQQSYVCLHTLSHPSTYECGVDVFLRNDVLSGTSRMFTKRQRRSLRSVVRFAHPTTGNNETVVGCAIPRTCRKFELTVGRDTVSSPPLAMYLSDPKIACPASLTCLLHGKAMINMYRIHSMKHKIRLALVLSLALFNTQHRRAT